MSNSDLLIGVIGKPSVGKSTFFNAVTDGKAKTGNYPFTTIEPNEGIAYYMTECVCIKYDKKENCQPKYGKCLNGQRYIPVKLIDIAGLIPGASTGAGLGNKFLDDIRHAHILLHIVDVSGTTNEKGEETISYDPINDIDWLNKEIETWIFHNLWKRWPNITRRHQATQSTLYSTFLSQLSGYGASSPLIHTVLTKLSIREPCNLTEWTENNVRTLVQTFIQIRFPMIYILNKVDISTSTNTDKNIEKIANKYGNERCFVASAAAEWFLKHAVTQKYINYSPGNMFYDELDKLKNNKKISKRLEKIADVVLLRYGSTGVQGAINAAVKLSDSIVVYPVKSLKNFSSIEKGDDIEKKGKKGVFGNAILIKRGCTAKDVGMRISHVIGNNFLYAEGIDGRRLADDETIIQDNTIVRIYWKEPNNGNII